MNKICLGCKEELDLDCFGKDSSRKDGLKYYCKKCNRDSERRSIEKHNLEYEKALESGIKIKCGKCGEKKYVSEFKRHNGRKYGIQRQCKKCFGAYYKNYVKENHIKVRKYFNDKRKNDLEYRLGCVLRKRLVSSINRYSPNKKYISHVKDLGCTIPELIKYLEAKFLPGMDWSNYGSAWSIDHVYPLSKVNIFNAVELRKVCNYRNLRPLWVKENSFKYNKIEDGIPADMSLYLTDIS